jgi:hypothetical protein
MPRSPYPLPGEEPLHPKDEFTTRAVSSKRGNVSNLCSFEDAGQYAARYKNIWRGGPSVDELREQFQAMHPGTLGTTLARLARDKDDPPSIAALWRQYRSLNTPANEPIPTAPCAACDGTTWLTGHTDERGYRYARRCECHSTGQRQSRSRNQLSDEPMSFTEYRRRLEIRVRHGDPEAQLEDAGWTRTTPIIISISETPSPTDLFADTPL